MSKLQQDYEEFKRLVKEYLLSLKAEDTSLPWMREEGHIQLTLLATRFNSRIKIYMTGHELIQDIYDIDVFCKFEEPKKVRRFTTLGYAPISGKYNFSPLSNPFDPEKELESFKAHLGLVLPNINNGNFYD